MQLNEALISKIWLSNVEKIGHLNISHKQTQDVTFVACGGCVAVVGILPPGMLQNVSFFQWNSS